MNLYLISLFLHVLFACFWIGGMLFLPLVVLPGIKGHPDKIELLYKTGVKFRNLGWITLILLLFTGFSNAWLRELPITFDFFLVNNYGKTMGLKILLFTFTLIIAGIHDFYVGEKAIKEMKSGKKSSLQLIARWSGRVNLLLALIMVYIGIVLSRGSF